MKKSKQKNGFTLAEVIVALSVSIVALAMLSILIVNLFSVFNNSTTHSQQTNDLRQTKLEISNFVNLSIQNDFQIDLTESFSNSLVFKKLGQQNRTMYFNNKQLFANGTVVSEFGQISTLSFALKNEMIICKVRFVNNSEISFIV